MRAYGPRCLFSSLKSGSFEMNASIGMTNAAVLPDPARISAKPEAQMPILRTGFCNADDVTILQTDRNGLPLNGRRFLVTDLVDNVQNWLRDCRFGPGTQWVWNLTT